MKYQPKTREKLKALCNNLSVNLGDIDTCKITDMSDLFYYSERKDFSGIENWDVSNVKDMQGMFCGAKFFNQPIGNWDVSNVQSMRSMFASAYSFNQDISRWDVSKVWDMSCMFFGAKSFNKPIGNWNVSNVTDMSCMFYFADSFNQDISCWDVSNVEDMASMFNTAEKFNQPIENWNVSSVKYMDDMFVAAWSFKRILPKEWAEKAGYKNPVIVKSYLSIEEKVSLDEISAVLSETVNDLTKRGAKIKDIDRVMKDMVRGVSR